MNEETSIIVVPTAPAHHIFTLDEQVAVWLNSKSKLSNSERTQELYQRHIVQFRNILHKAGLDLDSQDEVTIATLAEGWAGYSVEGNMISASTYNLRLSIVSSFYQFARKRRWMQSNPIEVSERRKAQTNKAALPLDAETVAKQLEAIDVNTLLGKRDYALLTLLFATGRRVTEMAELRTSDIAVSGTTMVITWQRCKGGKTMLDTLDEGVSFVLSDYLMTAFKGEIPPDQPIWISQSRQHRNLKEYHQISTQAISDVCKKYLGVSKVHTTRHTFAVMMEDAGAKLSDIGARLGHSNLAVTSKYMERLHSSENRFAHPIAQRLGIRKRG